MSADKKLDIWVIIASLVIMLQGFRLAYLNNRMEVIEKILQRKIEKQERRQKEEYNPPLEKGPVRYARR